MSINTGFKVREREARAGGRAKQGEAGWARECAVAGPRKARVAQGEGRRRRGGGAAAAFDEQGRLTQQSPNFARRAHEAQALSVWERVAIVEEGGATLVKRSQGRVGAPNGDHRDLIPRTARVSLWSRSGSIRKNTERLHASHALVPTTCSRHLAGTFHLVLKPVADVYSAQLQPVAAKMGDQAKRCPISFSDPLSTTRADEGGPNNDVFGPSSKHYGPFCTSTKTM
ncbi:hypothetical protein B0H17DRAFT_1135979 [Mycena rosella]|uniref:Uncharacterized protein n=1 Tax=Mycena rosella TaxID=1033263 RepID=A0AAD7GCH8_MYCRO|nr:hypothetical protein B0H17DRAFT_1135979 [Mycena rosella]